MLKIWGHDNCIWSSDYPRGNVTRTESRAFIAKQIGDLDYGTKEKLTSKNVMDLYKQKIKFSHASNPEISHLSFASI